MKYLRLIFTRRHVLRAAFALALLITLWAAFCLEERWRGQRKWHAYREAALARGAKLDLKDVLPPEVPDAENFAAIPMFRELFAAQEAGKKPPQWFAALKLDGHPAMGKPEQPTDLAKWRDHFVKQGVIAAASDEAPAEVLKALAIIEPELTALREAGRRPHAVFPVRWDRGFEAALPHLSVLMQTSRVHRLAMSAHFATGDSPAAYANFRDGLRLYEALRTEPVLISGLVRLAVLGLLDTGVREGLSTGKWAEPELRKLAADFAALRIPEDWRFAIESERAAMNTTFDSLKPKSDGELARFAEAIDGVGAPPSQVPLAANLVVGLYPRGWIDLSQWKLNEYFDAALTHIDQVIAGEPPPRSDPADMLKVIKGKGTLASLPYVLALVTGPAVAGVQDKYLEALARTSQTRAALALELHRLAHDSFPEKLEALGEVPRDPMDQQPLRYRRTETGYELWSIALNRTDDGAKTIEGKQSKEQPDWVLRR